MSIDTITREEQYLNRLTGETDQAIPEPETRKEQYLSRLCGADNIIPQNPITREEQYLANLCGEEVEMPEPETRLEQFMAFAGSQQESKPEPITRKEQLWDKYQGGAVPEEKTVSGTLIHITDAVEEPATKLAVTMTPSQEATPFVGDTTTEPYLSKTASTTGNKRYLDKIIGGTVAWNQLVDTDTTSVTVPTYHKYIAKINGTWTSGDEGTVSVTGGTDMLIDLTLMFGSTIADYIYSLEQSEAGAGVRWLKDHGFIDDNYRAYNAGELISAKPTAFTVGANSYTLGGVDLRGLFKLDSNNNLYCDGDIYPPSGQISERYGIVDLGSLEWTYTTYNYFRAPLSELPTPVSGGIADAICNKYPVYTGNQSNFPDKTIWVSPSNISPLTKYVAIKDSAYSDATAFATAMDGVYLVHKLETPITSTSTPYTNPAPIQDGDTESFTDSRAVPIPCGNESHYAGEYEITGTTGVTVCQSGENLFDANDLAMWNTANPIQITISDNTINLKNMVNYTWCAAGTKNNAFNITSGDVYILKYKVKINSSTSNRVMVGFRNNAVSTSFLSGKTIAINFEDFDIGNWNEYSKIFTFDQNYTNIVICFAITGSTAGKANVDFKDVELIKAARTYSVSFTSQGTVYGGTVDIVSGELVVEWTKLELPTTGWNTYTDGSGFFVCRRTLDAIKVSGNTGNWKCSHFSKGSEINKVYNFHTNYYNLEFRKEGIASLDDWKEFLTNESNNGTPVTVVYKMTTPQTYTLTPQEVQMLLGENYFWAENGESMELTYKARAAQRVLAMNRKLSLNKQALEIKRNGGVIIDKPIIKPIDKGGLKL